MRLLPYGLAASGFFLPRCFTLRSFFLASSLRFLRTLPSYRSPSKDGSISGFFSAGEFVAALSCCHARTPDAPLGFSLLTCVRLLLRKRFLPFGPRGPPNREPHRRKCSCSWEPPGDFAETKLLGSDSPIREPGLSEDHLSRCDLREATTASGRPARATKDEIPVSRDSCPPSRGACSVPRLEPSIRTLHENRECAKLEGHPEGAFVKGLAAGLRSAR